ncbi:MAG: S-adenosylmethionine decarboxylase [Candidatus Nanoarchaeia archaeon]
MNYKKLKQEFVKKRGWGLLASYDLHKCNPKTIRDAKKIREFVVQLCNMIDMKRYGPCTVVNFGSNEKVAGFSMVQLIDSSLISAHFANQTNNVYLDVFSCKLFDPDVVSKFAKKFFEAKDIKFHKVIRK